MIFFMIFYSFLHTFFQIQKLILLFYFNNDKCIIWKLCVTFTGTNFLPFPFTLLHLENLENLKLHRVLATLSSIGLSVAPNEKGDVPELFLYEVCHSQ